ncbi:hypothetical protein J6590_080201 [Homalodisca vitripennis]|nr:hypothetical protein J6590_080201 [Homalodisca vitripennis]
MSLNALQVALQTMKERCQLLQQRLVVVEDENLRLGIENQKVGSHEIEALNVLQEHIAKLSGQISQLTHHIYMVETENKQLWTRLSKLIEGNDSLGSHLTKISNTSNKHSVGESSKQKESVNTVDSCEKEVDNGSKKDYERSLPETLAVDCRPRFTVQVCFVVILSCMSALQTGTLSLEDCNFTLGTGLTEQEEVAQDLRKVMENMREQKEQLLKQQASLRATLATLTALVKIVRKQWRVIVRDSEIDLVISSDCDDSNECSDVPELCEVVGGIEDVVQSDHSGRGSDSEPDNDLHQAPRILTERDWQSELIEVRSTVSAWKQSERERVKVNTLREKLKSLYCIIIILYLSYISKPRNFTEVKIVHQ